MANNARSMYAAPWQVLKSKGTVTLQITGSENPKTIKKFAATYRKAMQKRKYLDEDFRIKFPFAKITSTLEGNKITFSLEYNDYKHAKVSLFSEDEECDANDLTNIDAGVTDYE